MSFEDIWFSLVPYILYKAFIPFSTKTTHTLPLSLLKILTIIVISMLSNTVNVLCWYNLHVTDSLSVTLLGKL